MTNTSFAAAWHDGEGLPGAIPALLAAPCSPQPVPTMLVGSGASPLHPNVGKSSRMGWDVLQLSPIPAGCMDQLPRSAPSSHPPSQTPSTPRILWDRTLPTGASDTFPSSALPLFLLSPLPRARRGTFHPRRSCWGDLSCSSSRCRYPLPARRRWHKAVAHLLIPLRARRRAADLQSHPGESLKSSGGEAEGARFTNLAAGP